MNMPCMTGQLICNRPVHVAEAQHAQQSLVLYSFQCASLAAHPAVGCTLLQTLQQPRQESLHQGQQESPLQPH